MLNELLGVVWFHAGNDLQLSVSLLTLWAMKKRITLQSNMITATPLRVSLNATVWLSLRSVSAGVTGFSELFFIKEPHDVTVLRRDAVMLDCQAHGEAPIGIRWLKNGATLTESERVYLLTNSSLFISEVESRKDKSDEGFYQCLAQNKYGSILSQRARLTIAGKLHWWIWPDMCHCCFISSLVHPKTNICYIFTHSQIIRD